MSKGSGKAPSGKTPASSKSRGAKDLTPEDHRLWTRVSGSVTPPRARKAARITPGAMVPGEDAAPVAASASRPIKAPPRPQPRLSITAKTAPAIPKSPRGVAVPEPLEPNRQRRLSRERDPIEATLDLHGFGRFEAEDQMRTFLVGCQARGMRAVMVITGQGRMGGGVIRASVHEWLQGPALRGVVSGFASAARRHGGDGAIYVTLKRR